jgi:hypothetical protein
MCLIKHSPSYPINWRLDSGLWNFPWGFCHGLWLWAHFNPGCWDIKAFENKAVLLGIIVEGKMKLSSQTWSDQLQDRDTLPLPACNRVRTVPNYFFGEKPICTWSGGERNYFNCICQDHTKFLNFYYYPWARRSACGLTVRLLIFV